MKKMGESKEKIKNICSIIEQGDKHVFEAELQIKYYKDAMEVDEKIIKMNQFANDKTKNEDQEIGKQIKKVQFIRRSVEEDQEVVINSLFTHQKLEKITNKELILKTQKSRQIKEEFQTVSNEVKKKRVEIPDFRELEEARVNFLKVDIQHRTLEVDMRIKKRIIVEKRVIQQKLYSNYFVNMAAYILVQKNMTEVRAEKKKELETFNKLMAAQEEHKMRQKSGSSKDRLKRLPKLTFGSQEVNNDKSANTQIFKIPEQPKPVVQQQKPIKATQSEEPLEISQKHAAKVKFSDKLAKLFNDEEPAAKEKVAPIVKIIDQTVIIPAFVPPAPVKRKKQVALTNVWQKSLKTRRSSQSSNASQESRTSTQETQPEFDTSQNSCVSNNSADESQVREFIVPSGLPSQISQTPAMTKEPLTLSQPTPIKHQSKSALRNMPKSILTPQSRVGTSKVPVGESKTVRFKVDHAPSKESAMYSSGATFGQIFPQGMFQNTPFNESQVPSESYAYINNSLMDTSDHGLTFDADSNAASFTSPDGTYAIEAEEEPQQQAFGAFSFGANPGNAGGKEGGDGGMFSFGPTMLNF